MLQLVQNLARHCRRNIVPIIIEITAKFFRSPAAAHAFGAQNLDILFAIKHACIDEREDFAATFAGEVADVLFKKSVSDIVVYISKFWKFHIVLPFILTLSGSIVRIISNFG